MLLKKTAKDSGGANFLVKKCGIPFCFLFHSLFHTLRAEHLIILLPPVCILHSTKTKKYRQKATKESIDTIMLLLYFCIHANMLMLPSCTCNMTTMEMDSHWHGFFPNSRVSLGSKSCTRMNGSVKAPLKGIEIPSPNKIQILLKKKKKKEASSTLYCYWRDFKGIYTMIRYKLISSTDITKMETKFYTSTEPIQSRRVSSA